MLEAGGRLLRVDSGRETESAREGSRAPFRDPILGSCGSANSRFLVGGCDLSGRFLGVRLFGIFLRFLFDGHVLGTVGFLSGCLFVDLLSPAADGDGLLVVSKLDVDLRLLVSGDFELDFVAALNFGDVGPVGSPNIGIAEERGVHVEEGKVIDIVGERSVVDPREER